MADDDVPRIEYVYVTIADGIERDIKSGRIPLGARLPGIVDLAEQHAVATGTIRRAVRLLRERGLVQTLPAKGTYVVWTGNE